MAINKTELLEFLEEVDKVLGKPITLTAVGGTAMTLLNLKASTIDIDFDLSAEDVVVFRKAIKSLPPGHRVDIFTEGMVFSQQLPSDYLQKCIPVRKLGKIRLLALNPLDIVVTKIGRLNERDVEDIKSCIKKFKLVKKDVEKRALQVVYIGHEDNYRANLDYALREMF
ncbi:MAG: hypothetical protein KJ955_05110 [Nanoarchaeota archaeon]|nr:hypothetical protein [Nanoarchaeota archaeon]